MTVEDMSETSGPPGETEEEMKVRKRKERLEQNRISARESRKRKKTMIEELQRTVITLSKENKELNERNETLRRQLMEIGAKYPNIVPLQAIVGQATATPPAGEAPAAGGGASGGTGAGGNAAAAPADGVPSTAASSNAAAQAPSFMGSLNPMTWLGGQKPADDNAPAGGSGTASV